MAVITLCNHENCTVILSTTHTKHYDQARNSSSSAHPHFWQLHTADGRQTYSIFVTFPNQKKTPDTQTCQLYTMLRWHPRSTSFPASDTSNYFLDFWHYCVSFMAFLSTVCVAVFQNVHSLSMQYRCHATKKNGEVHTQNILFVHQLSTEKYRLSFSIDLTGSATTTIPTHFI